jgi:hypothetical protein
MLDTDPTTSYERCTPRINSGVLDLHPQDQTVNPRKIFTMHSQMIEYRTLSIATIVTTINLEGVLYILCQCVYTSTRYYSETLTFT